MSERKYQEKIDQAKVDANKFIAKSQDESLLAEAMKEKPKRNRAIGGTSQKI